MDKLFSDRDRQRIVDAIEEAEAQTAAEVVPYVVVQSDAYPATRWRGGVLAGLLTLGLVSLLRMAPFPELGVYLSESVMLASALSMGLLGAFTAGMIPSLTRALTPGDELDRAVFRRAMQAFVEENVFATRHRTGILLFVSLMEHRIEVLADEGIDQKVDETAWTDVADHIRWGIEKERLTRGLLDGIACCGRLLDEHGVEASPSNESKFHNRLRSESE